MNRKNPILALTSIVLVFFLFAPIVVRSLHTYSAHSKTTGLSKSSGAPTKADSQMPFEEKEKEEKGIDDSLAQLPLIYILTEYIPFTSESTSTYPDVRNSGFCGNTPLYLAKRSILI
jgi:hypothetical protein